MSKKRFLFDIHNFDKPEPKPVPEEPMEEKAPPPPMYSEDEMMAIKEVAKEDGIKLGRQDGYRESEEGFTGKIHELTQTLSNDVKLLLGQERQRQDQFENELSALVQQTLATALPNLMKQGDFDECLATIETTLKHHRHSGRLLIKVNKDYIEPLETYFEQYLPEEKESVKFSALHKPTEDKIKHMTIEWEHGGATREPEELKQNILKVLEEALAQNDLSPQNEEEINQEPQE